MATRRKARQWAMQVLFELDLNPKTPEEALADFWHLREQAEQETKDFTEALVMGVRSDIESIDALIQKYAENWDIERMHRVDRNVMRIALYEMLNCDDIPPVVSINEAVDISKEFADSSSGSFVNGILDRARKDIDRPARDAVKTKD